MFQALIKKGRVLVGDVPAPVVSTGSVLIRVVYSCISAGTEMSLIQASGISLIRRAIQEPEKVAKALKMFMMDGPAQTLAKVRSDVEIGKPIGYSLAGIVVATGKEVVDLRPGDRVAAAGAGIANHAEWVDVPRNLVTILPEEVDFKKGSTVALGGIALQGVRRAQIQLGEFVVVFGTGILGLLAVQMARLAGGRCIAVDLDERRLDLARQFGAELTVNITKEASPVIPVMHLTCGHGADTVIFSAATSNPSDLTQAFAMVRRKGRMVMVGTYGKELHREDIYAKEIDFLISTSYGPGRYDDNYEQKGLDYPYDYVRWTENRNMGEYLRLLATGNLDVTPLIEAIYPIHQISEAFATIAAPDRPLIVLLDYGKPDLDLKDPENITRKIATPSVKPVLHEGKIRVGIIGVGDFAKNVHLPNLQKLSDKYELIAVCSRTGASAKAMATRFGANYATTDYREIINDPAIDLVMICTRHNLHGKMVLESIMAGKHTFVEKPLCITQSELDSIKTFYGFAKNCSEPSAIGYQPLLMVGFNRRFSRYMQEAKKYTKERINPLFIYYRCNAGFFSRDHWTQGEEGGGRIIGEACHILDLFAFLTESEVKSLSTSSLTPKAEPFSRSDNKVIVLEYQDGSIATFEYFSVGSKTFPKEYLEIHFDERTIILDNFTAMKGYGLKIDEIKTPKSEKGHLEELIALYESLKKKHQWPIPLSELIQTTELTFLID